MNQEGLVSKICNCIEALLCGKKAESSPSRCNAKDRKEALFYELKKNVHFAFEAIEKSEVLKSSVKKYITICHKKKCKTCDYLNFLELCLVLMKLLSEALLAEETEQKQEKEGKASVPKGILSISQQKIVKNCLQFIVALGILPNLLHGIGVPLSRRMEYAKMLEHFASDISPRQKHAQIAVCLETLLCCIERSALQGIIHYHGTDLLAALFQLCHAPIKKTENKNDTENDEIKLNPEIYKNFFALKLPVIKDYSSFSDQQLISEMVEDRNYFTPKLERFLKQICPSLLLWELLLFQGIPIRGDDSEYTTSRVPLWLRKICSQMLTDMILQNHGIASFVQVVLDKAYDVDVQQGSIDNVRLDAVARLVVYNPIRHISLEEYTQRLSKQVFDLLRVKGTQMDVILQHVASSIILHTCDKDLKSGEKYYLETLLQPLWMCVSTTFDSSLRDPKIIVSEKDLSNCLEDIHKIFVQNNSPLSRKHIKLLYPFFHCFSHMYFFLLEGVSALKTKVKNLLLNILSSASHEDAISLLHAATFSTIVDEGTLIYMTTVDFAYGEESGIGAVKRYEEDYSDLDINCRAILGLLSELKNKNLNRSFFLLILKVFCSYRNKVLIEPNDPKYERFRNLFSAIMQELPEWEVDVREALSSNIGEVVDIVIMLIELVLVSEANDYDETIMMVLMVLSTIFSGDKELLTSEWAILKKCLPSLEELVKKPIKSYMKDMIFFLITFLTTHGAVGGASFEELMQKCVPEEHQQSSDTFHEALVDNETEDLSQNNPKQELSASSDSAAIKELVGKLSGADSSDNSSKLASDLELMLKLNRDLNKKIQELSAFESAIKDVKNSSIPIKGHGLIAVQKLLSCRDKETLSYKKELLDMFQEGLDNGDSYVYLSAIQCLSLLADIDAELVLPTVLKAYQNTSAKSTDFILKTGEVLLKVCRSLGELLYKYKDQLLHTYLNGAKHEDPQIRSSSLSNLGEACMYLKFNISGHWLQEILMCVHSLLKTDKDLEVRRCAVMVITLLLRGIGRDLFQILENEIKDIYNQLKIVYTTENDDVLRLHSQLALEEINTIMKELLSIQLPLTKEIRILRH